MAYYQLHAGLCTTPANPIPWKPDPVYSNHMVEREKRRTINEHGMTGRKRGWESSLVFFERPPPTSLPEHVAEEAKHSPAIPHKVAGNATNTRSLFDPRDGGALLTTSTIKLYKFDRRTVTLDPTQNLKPNHGASGCKLDSQPLDQQFSLVCAEDWV